MELDTIEFGLGGDFPADVREVMAFLRICLDCPRSGAAETALKL
jgi:hypothetical protein